MVKQPKDCEKTVFKAIELFAGIGGIRLGFSNAFGKRIKFVWANDNNKSAVVTYKANFGEDAIDGRDINAIIEEDIAQIPEHDILMAGFPCQPFSIAGWQKGFEDKTRGTLFYSIAKVLERRKPSAFMLENVPYFEHHNKGKTWATVRNVLRKDLKYNVFAGKLNAKYFGVPQNRQRFFMVGFKDKDNFFEFPKEKGKAPVLSTILQHNVDCKYFLSQQYLNTLIKHKERHEAKGHGFGYKVHDPEKDIAQTLVVGGMGKERNLIKNSPLPDCWQPGDDTFKKKNNQGVRKLTPRECARLQGFKDSFVIPVADSQAYKQFANSVSVPVIEAIARNMLVTLDNACKKGIVAGQLTLPKIVNGR